MKEGQGRWGAAPAAPWVATSIGTVALQALTLGPLSFCFGSGMKLPCGGGVAGSGAEAKMTFN